VLVAAASSSSSSSSSGGLSVWRCSFHSELVVRRDVRAAVDLCHRDGSLKQSVAADPEKYMHPDLRLAPTLDMLRAAGKKLFLATNSQWDFTNVVMNFLLTGAAGPVGKTGFKQETGT